MTPMAAGPPDPAPGRSDATMPGSRLRAFLRTPFTARIWREHLYLAIAAALGLAGFIALAILLYVSLLLSITLIGIPLLALTVLAAREWAGALALLAYPIMWYVFEPTNTDANGVAHHSGLQFGEFYIDTWPLALAVSAAGLVGVFLIPWFVRGVTTVEGLLVRGLLGPTSASPSC
jgi:Putative sensor